MKEREYRRGVGHEYDEEAEAASSPRGWPGRRTLVEVEAARFGRRRRPVGPPVGTAMIAREALAGAETPEGAPPAAVRDALEHEAGGVLPEEVAERHDEEAGVGADPGAARIVTGPRAELAAEAIGARAFTVGDRIFFGAGEFAPGTAQGDELLRHELTHVAQQRGAAMPAIDDLRVTSPGDASEVEARGGAGPASGPAAGAVEIARDKRAEPAPQKWLEVLEGEVVPKLVLQLAGATFPTGEPAVRWRSGLAGGFLLATLAPVRGGRVRLWDHLGVTLAPLDPAVVVARAQGMSTDRWSARALVSELRVAYVEAAREALARVLPRWLALRASSDGQEPAPAQVLASHPFDATVAAALAGLLEDVPGAARGAVPQQAGKAELRAVHYSFELGRGLRSWIRVDAPGDATPEEVARALYGNEKWATTLLRVGRRFAFEPGRLRGAASASFIAAVQLDQERRDAAAPRLPGRPALRVERGYRTDALDQLDHDSNYEQLVSEAAASAPATVDPFVVLASLRLALFPLQEAAADAALFGMARQLEQARARIEARSLRLSAGSTPASELARWGRQAEEQLDIVARATQGLAQAASYLRQLAGGQEVHVEALPPEAAALLGPIGRGYASAAAHAELPELGRAELLRADTRAGNFAFDQLAAELRGARRDQVAVRGSERQRLGDDPGRRGDDLLEQRTDALRDRLADARLRATSGPAAAAGDLESLQRDIATVRGQTTAAVNRERADQLVVEMEAHLSLIGAFTGKNGSLHYLGRWFGEWRRKWQHVQLQYLASREAGDRAMAALREDGTFEQSIEHAVRYIHKKEHLERWIKLVLQLGATLGLMLASGGTAALARGAMVAGGWSALPMAVEAGALVVEAGTFTMLSAVVLDEHKTLGDLFLDFVGNLAVFGVLRGVGAASKGSLLIEFETIFAIEAGKEVARGGGLSKEKALEIGAHALVMMVGSKLLARWGQGLMSQLEASGAGIGAEWRAFERARTGLLRQARDLKQSRSPAKAKRALAKQAELLALERQLIDAGSRMTASRFSPAELGDLQAIRTRLHGRRGANLAEQAATERARIALELRQVTPTQYLVKKGQLTRGGRPDSVAQRLAALGDEITLHPPDPVTGARSATVKPKDGSRTYRIAEDVSAADAAKWRDKRVETPAAAPARGTTDLHNHLLGVTDLAFWIAKVGEGDSKRLLGRVVRAMAERSVDPATRRARPALREQIPATWAVAQQAMRDLQALPARQRSGAEGEAIAQEALEKIFGASEATPFDNAYEIRDALIKKHLGYDAFVEGVLESLAAEGVDYSEQSVSLKKLVGDLQSGAKGVFDEQMMNKLRERMARRGAVTDLRFLGMVHTSALSGKMSGPEFAKTQAQVDAALGRGDTIGLDIAGPEKELFTPAGMKNFVALYQQVAAAAAKRGRPLVLRPHVGEGYQAGDPNHAKTAQENLQTLIKALQGLEYSAAKGAKDGVIIRFGHATHATEAQLIAIRALGIYIEANIGSNMATGSVKSETDHPLLLALYHQTPTILSTDGQGVMGTNLPAEYETARSLIKRFRAGPDTINVDGGDRTFESLNAVERARFDMEVLLRWEREYRSAAAASDAKDRRRPR